jgi:hypothetical protein
LDILYVYEYLISDFDTTVHINFHRSSKVISGTQEKYFFCLVSLGGVRLSPLGTSATVGLLYQPRMIDDDYGAVGELELAGETEVLGENLPQCHFVHHKSHMTWDRTRAAAVGGQRLNA